MEILGIGPLELLFILLIALIVLGPTDMVRAGRTLGRFFHRIVTSPGWRTFQQASRELRYLPNKLMRDAGLEELEKDLQQVKDVTQQAGSYLTNSDLGEWKKDISPWTTPPSTTASPANPPGLSNHEEPSAESKEETERSEQD